MANPITSPHQKKLLSKLQWQKHTSNCGPYTAAVVINALRGQELIGSELAEQINKPRRRGSLPIIRRWPNSATFPWGMVDIFRDYGLQARWWPRVPLSYLRPALANGHILMPIVGEWRPKIWSHIMTLVAWNPAPNKGWGFANTQHNHKNISWWSDQDFQDQWNKYARLMVEIEKP